MSGAPRVLINIHHDINDGDYVDGVRVMTKEKWEKYKKLLLKARLVSVTNGPQEDPRVVTGERLYNECQVIDITENEYQILKKLEMTYIGVGLPELDENDINEELKIVNNIKKAKKIIKLLIKDVKDEMDLNKELNLKMLNNYFLKSKYERWGYNDYDEDSIICYFFNIHTEDNELRFSIHIYYDNSNKMFYFCIELGYGLWNSVMSEGRNTYKVDLKKATYKNVKDLLLTYIKIYEERIKVDNTDGPYDKCNELRLSLMKFGHEDDNNEGQRLVGLDFYRDTLKLPDITIPGIENFSNSSQAKDIINKLNKPDFAAK